MAIGGPALTMWVRPTEEELFERYSPELKQKSLEQRHQREKEFDDFVTRLKEQSKSDKNSTSPPSSSLPLSVSPSRDPAIGKIGGGCGHARG